jgi:catechol 2,3-dioxygenase-like lactoylglutathione lyase family enzyme
MEMIKNRKHDHVGLATNDLEATVKWYVEELGFEEYGKCVAPDGTPIRFIKGKDIRYEIFQPVNGVDAAVQGKIDHIAFVSNDIEKDYRYCMEKGYRDTTDGIQGIPTAWERGNRYFKVATSTGEEIEFCQVL